MPAYGLRAIATTGSKLRLRLVAARSSTRGRLEGVSRGQVHGWVFGSTAMEHCLVRLTTDNGHSVEVRADRYRADLASAGIGDGHCGFAAPVSAFDGARLVRAAVASTGWDLPNSPLSLDRTGGPSSDLVGSIRFRIDRHGRLARITGWVLDGDDPTRRVLVGLCRHGTVLAEARATRYRADIAADGSDALHGFVLTCPGLKAKQVDIVALESGVMLAKLRASA